MNLNWRQQGFTLIELMVVLIISGIIVAIAVPSMGNLVAQQRVQNRIDQVLALFQFSKAEAMRINKPIIICPTVIKNNTAQSNGCVDWKTDNKQQGLLAFSDDNLSQIYEFNNDTLLRSVLFGQNKKNDPDVRVTTTGEVCTTSSDSSNISCTALNRKNKLIFMPDGRFGWGDDSVGWVLGTANVRLTISDAEKPEKISRQIVVTPGGKAIVCPVSTTANSLSYCKRNE